VCPKCVERRERLVVLTPALDVHATGDATVLDDNGLPFTAIRIPLDAGKAASVTGVMPPSAIEEWRHSGAKPTHAKNVRFGLDVTRGSSEEVSVARILAREIER